MRKKRWEKGRKLFIPFVIALFAFAGYANAETRYVSDLLIITLRAGEGDEYKVIKTLRSNTPLEVIAEDGEFLNVRTNEGDEGWVRKRYTTEDTPKPTIISRLNEGIDIIKKKNQELEKDKIRLWDEFNSEKNQHSDNIKSFQKQIAAIEAKNKKLQSELDQTKEAYNTLLNNSSNVVEITKNEEKLEKEKKDLNAEIKGLNLKIAALGEKNTGLIRLGIIRWFLAGAGVLIFGLILGKISRKKDYY